MAQKRPGSIMETLYAPGANKRQVLADLVQNIGLDDGDGPYPPAYLPTAADYIDLDALCNEAYENHFPPQHSSTQLAVNISPPEGMTKYPRCVLVKDFPLTKQHTKVIQMGIDINTMSPYILLLGEPNSKGNRKWVRMTTDEFDVLISNEIQQYFMPGLQDQSETAPITVGGLILKLFVHPSLKSMTSVTLQRQNSPIEINLGFASWKMMQRSVGIVRKYLKFLNTCSTQAKNNFPAMKRQCVYYCGQHKMSSTDHETLLQDAIKNSSVPFPDSILDEVICYHMDYLREQFIQTK